MRWENNYLIIILLIFFTLILIVGPVLHLLLWVGTIWSSNNIHIVHLVLLQIDQGVEEVITGVTAPVALPLLVPLQLVRSLKGAITHVTCQLLLIWGAGAREQGRGTRIY